VVRLILINKLFGLVIAIARTDLIKKTDLQAVVSEHYGAVYRLGCALAKNQTDVADLTQETFLILAKNQDHIREPEETKCWLFTTLRREFLRRSLKRASDPEVPFYPEEHDSPATRPSAQHQIDAKLVLSSLAKVDESYRATLELFYVGDLSYKQISTALKIPIGTVMSHLARGKQQLKQILHDEFPEPTRLGIFRPQ
jgi:RNA polymerase sigma-70 factor (ECF subfamily)